jgi:RNA polymerase sigma-70 factor, ECF subfamily
MLQSNYTEFFRRRCSWKQIRRVSSEEGMSSFASDEQFVSMVHQQRSGTALQEQVTRLFEESRDDVYRYLLTLGLYPPRAQEAVQEVFLRLYATMRKGEQIQSPRAWIFRVAHNLGLKIRARQQSEEPFDADVRSKYAVRAATPESELIERERMVRFHDAVQGLSEQQKRCLLLRMEGLRYPEIGSVLGISASAVGEFLRRAMLRLRKVRDD